MKQALSVIENWEKEQIYHPDFCQKLLAILVKN